MNEEAFNALLYSHRNVYSSYIWDRNYALWALNEKETAIMIMLAGRDSYGHDM